MGKMGRASTVWKLNFLHFPDFVKCPHVSCFLTRWTCLIQERWHFLGPRTRGIALQLPDFPNLWNWVPNYPTCEFTTEHWQNLWLTFWPQFSSTNSINTEDLAQTFLPHAVAPKDPTMPSSAARRRTCCSSPRRASELNSPLGVESLENTQRNCRDCCLRRRENVSVPVPSQSGVRTCSPWGHDVCDPETHHKVQRVHMCIASFPPHINAPRCPISTGIISNKDESGN